jgi:hypothetical protein
VDKINAWRCGNAFQRTSLISGVSIMAALLAGCSGVSDQGSNGSSAMAALAAMTGAVTTERAIPPVAVTATVGNTFNVGVNVGGSVYYSTERTFANLAKASGVWRDPSSGWADIPTTGLNRSGYPIKSGVLFLVVPQAVRAGVATNVTCTWSGSGTVRIDGDARKDGSNHSLSFIWPGAASVDANPTIFVAVDSINAADPFNNLDCREPGLVSNGVFDQRLVDDLKPYTVLRFLDWSSANNNPASVTWAERSTPDKLVQNGADGVALEHMIDLANASGSDVWFTVPYNADQNYVQQMAALVRDRLSQSHKAYFELSNETWNFGFPVASQALNEGVAENLSADHYTNNLLRYAEKSTWLHKLLSQAYASNMSRLVRVLNVQNGQAYATDQELNFRDTAKYVDVIASAPYFGHNFFDGPNAGITDLSTLFTSLEKMRVETISNAVAVKGAATRHSKIYVTYEGGQHIIPRDGNASDSAIAAAMERNSSMHDIYVRYLNDLKAQGVSTAVIYSATGPINKHGAWGIREYAGQPLSQTPKRRAVLEFAR